MEVFRNPPRLRWRSLPLIVAGLVAGGLVLSPAVGQAAAFLTKKKAEKRYLGNNSVITTTTTAPAGDGTTVTVPCPPGRQATGGGVDSPLFGVDSSESILIDESKPVVAGAKTSGWNVEVVNTTTGSTPITVYAVCSP